MRRRAYLPGVWADSLARLAKTPAAGRYSNSGSKVSPPPAAADHLSSTKMRSTMMMQSPSSFDDHVQPFQIETPGLRGRLVRLGPAVDAALAGHDYPRAGCGDAGRGHGDGRGAGERPEVRRNFHLCSCRAMGPCG